jgi:hypothetical protein
MKEPQTFWDVPEIPPEIWKELAKLQAFQNALTGSCLLIMASDSHSRTMKAIQDQLTERERKNAKRESRRPARTG